MSAATRRSFPPHTHDQYGLGVIDAGASWAIRFYERHGFRLVAPRCTRGLLETYWRIGERQLATSVVLAHPPYEGSLSLSMSTIL